ncbi:hypothetical protein B0T17DRAFT_614397 [Bombardia bombarda]|uniref:Uncharacterized protein n=1 Tax=Bombardia bombarda TaxID=252184 RepID=A0AA40C847_9PEZI|nr:hypothetical protein B0T17DRAFT_614397 [Bombardia bombarda]
MSAPPSRLADASMIQVLVQALASGTNNSVLYLVNSIYEAKKAKLNLLIANPFRNLVEESPRNTEIAVLTEDIYEVPKQLAAAFCDSLWFLPPEEDLPPVHIASRVTMEEEEDADVFLDDLREWCPGENGHIYFTLMVRYVQGDSGSGVCCGVHPTLIPPPAFRDVEREAFGETLHHAPYSFAGFMSPPA